MRRREDLSRPRRGRLSFGVHYDPEAFGDFSEAIARLLGTARFLVFQTAVVFAWIFVNAAFIDLRFDKYPFILLNLLLSCVAALQGAILLIAAKRSDQISSELARHDYHADLKAERLVEKLSAQFAQMTAQHEALSRQVAELTAALQHGQVPHQPRTSD